MALIECPECGQNVSDRAAACPNCGYPVSAMIEKQKKDIDDLYDLGCKYLYGIGMPKDIDIGIEYLRKAAEQGHSKAQYSLGVMYAQGEKVKQDFSKAAEWFSKAAEQGNGSAQLKLAYMYQYG